MCGRDTRDWRWKGFLQGAQAYGRAIGNVWSLDGLWRGRVVYIRVLARGARLDGEEFVKGKDAGFAAFPA